MIIHCAQCGKPIEKMYRRKYCSQKCRQGYYFRKKKGLPPKTTVVINFPMKTIVRDHNVLNGVIQAIENRFNMLFPKLQRGLNVVIGAEYSENISIHIANKSESTFMLDQERIALDLVDDELMTIYPRVIVNE